MDTSPTYILMCEKAEEIQTDHIFSLGDVCYGYPYEDEQMAIGLYRLNDWAYDLNPTSHSDTLYRESWIWLPRQDQLQEIIKRFIGSDLPQIDGRVFYSFNYFVSQLNPDFEHQSLEQLWLAFVMKEKYSKTWNGEDWI